MAVGQHIGYTTHLSQHARRIFRGPGRCQMTGLGAFAPSFSRPTFEPTELWRVGAVRAPGRRTVTAVLRGMGQSVEAHVHNDHCIPHRARWSARAAGRMRLTPLLDAFVPEGPVVLGIEEAIARRRGEKSSAKGIYRDPVRASPTHVVNASGRRWACLMGRAPIPWIARLWALPFLAMLAPWAH